MLQQQIMLNNSYADESRIPQLNLQKITFDQYTDNIVVNPRIDFELQNIYLFRSSHFLS